LSVQVNPNYVDAATQPTSFKVYPRFYRRLQLNRNNPIHTFLWLTSAITWEKIYQDSPYKLRVNPSAGALYPTGIYVQIRGLEGIIDGIYHIEVENNCLTLIYELGDDGLDNYVIPNKCINGFIFLLIYLYHRSSWKYQDRSLRYCWLDSGHHLGAIAALTYLHENNIQLRFDFDKLTLNADLRIRSWLLVVWYRQEVREKPVRRATYSFCLWYWLFSS